MGSVPARSSGRMGTPSLVFSALISVMRAPASARRSTSALRSALMRWNSWLKSSCSAQTLLNCYVLTPGRHSVQGHEAMLFAQCADLLEVLTCKLL